MKTLHYTNLIIYIICVLAASPIIYNEDWIFYSALSILVLGSAQLIMGLVVVSWVLKNKQLKGHIINYYWKWVLFYFITLLLFLIINTKMYPLLNILLQLTPLAIGAFLVYITSTIKIEKKWIIT